MSHQHHLGSQSLVWNYRSSRPNEISRRSTSVIIPCPPGITVPGLKLPQQQAERNQPQVNIGDHTMSTWDHSPSSETTAEQAERNLPQVNIGDHTMSTWDHSPWSETTAEQAKRNLPQVNIGDHTMSTWDHSPRPETTAEQAKRNLPQVNIGDHTMSIYGNTVPIMPNCPICGVPPPPPPPLMLWKDPKSM